MLLPSSHLGDMTLTRGRNLPRFDYFSQSDPLCIVKYAKISSNPSAAAESALFATEIFRSEVVANDSNPEFAANFRFQPQAETFKDHKNDSGPAPSTLSFEFYDSHMRDAYRDSKSLQPKPVDLLCKVDLKLDEIFQPFVDMIAENVFKEQLENCLLYTSPSPRD